MLNDVLWVSDCVCPWCKEHDGVVISIYKDLCGYEIEFFCEGCNMNFDISDLNLPYYT